MSEPRARPRPAACPVQRAQPGRRAALLRASGCAFFPESSAARRAEDEEVGEDEEAEAPRSSGAEMERQVSRSSLQLGPQPCGSPARSVPGRGALGRSAASCPAQRSPRDEDPTADFLTSQEAATKIQAAFRGFCTRRELRRAFSEPPRPAPGPQDSP